MAEPRKTTERREESAERGLERAGRQGRGLAAWDPFDFRSGPFSLIRRMQEDMDRLFGSLGGGRGWMSPFGEEGGEWMPAIEAFQRGNDFVVRAEVPGIRREDLHVEVGEDVLTIRGERKYDHEEEREGVYRSERAYGSFCRVVPLPEGAMADSAKANFAEGVLEVVLQAPSQEVRRGRRIEIGSERPQQSDKR